MNAQEWLQKENKKPYTTGEFWYWACEDDNRDPYDVDFELPRCLYNNLQEKETYLQVKMYRSENEALNSFEQSFEQSKLDGWNPENRSGVPQQAGLASGE